MFENEKFEGVETETSAQAELVAASNEQVVFDKETGEVREPGAKFQALVETVGELETTVLASSAMPKKRGKRTEAEMIRALGGSSLKEASYVLDRIAKLEDKISELMASISQKGRERVIEERPELNRY